MPDEAQDALDQVIKLSTTYGLSVLGAIIILILGLWFSGIARRWTRKALGRSGKVDSTLIGFVSSLVRYVIIIFTVLAVLDQFGVETTSLIAMLGAAGLAVGLAVQGTLSNFAAGVMLLIFRPFRVGQYVIINGIAGTAKTVTLFTCELDTPDNVRIIVPNSQIWGQAITNYSFHDTRRMDIQCGIGYGDDIDKAIGVMKEIAEAESRVLDDPPPQVFVDALADSSVNLSLRVWCAAADYWQLKWDLTKSVKEGFDNADIEIPFPQRSVHLVGGGAVPTARGAE